MKISILALAALVSVTLAAPAPDDKDHHYDDKDHHYGGRSKCTIGAFKPSWSKIAKCCHKYKGGSDFDKDKNYLKCKLPIYYEGYMRKCVKNLGYASVVDCYY
ncbi:hypothetical protein BGZ93_004833 [Podila epicladia]|nr:hypothetical protein BGZ93_004833 [Podila epicladia]